MFFSTYLCPTYSCSKPQLNFKALVKRLSLQVVYIICAVVESQRGEEKYFFLFLLFFDGIVKLKIDLNRFVPKKISSSLTMSCYWKQGGNYLEISEFQVVFVHKIWKEKLFLQLRFLDPEVVNGCSLSRQVYSFNVTHCLK